MSNIEMPTLDDWAWMTTLFQQALIGVVSPNMRAITLSFAGKKWDAVFYIAEDNDEDREEINEAFDDFGIYIDDIYNFTSPATRAPIDLAIVVTAGEVSLSHEVHTRIIYKRRERPPSQQAC